MRWVGFGGLGRGLDEVFGGEGESEAKGRGEDQGAGQRVHLAIIEGNAFALG